MMDSYLSDELLVETNHEVLRHLENCPACRKELAARRGLLSQLRSAVKGAAEFQLNQAFATGLRNDLREMALRPSAWEKLKSEVFAKSSVFAATVAACLLFAATFGAVWIYRSLPAENAVVIEQNPTNQTQNQTNKLIEIPRPTESPAAQAVQIALRETMHTAIGDHKNCAVHFRLAEKPITLTEAARKYGRFYKDFDKTVIASLNKFLSENAAGKPIGKIEFVEAHSCVFQGRRFAHVILRHGKKIISLLVTDADSFDGGDIKIANQTDGNLQIAGFSASRHAVFVVSDLTEAENSMIAQMLSPVVRRHIERAEA